MYEALKTYLVKEGPEFKEFKSAIVELLRLLDNNIGPHFRVGNLVSLLVYLLAVITATQKLPAAKIAYIYMQVVKMLSEGE